MQVVRKRLLYLALFLSILFSLLIAQFFIIQITEGEKWAQEGAKQHFFTVKEPFLRGTFYSNTSLRKDHPETAQKLVVDILKFNLYIDPYSFPDKIKKEIAHSLATLLKICTQERPSFELNFFKKSRNRKIATWLEKERRDQIATWWNSYAKLHHLPRNALYFVHDYQRSYPFGKLLGPVLHTIQEIKDEKTGQAIPTGGMELYFNKYLEGKEGKRRLMRSPRNALETGEVIVKPTNGADIYLTINTCLQAIVEEELAKGVQKSQAKAGWAVMLEPQTGEILALAHYPFFYPSAYQQYFNQPKLIDQTRVKAISDANEPGSVMKPITMALALKANQELIARGEPALFNPEEKIATSDSRFMGRKNLKDTHLHHFLNMNMALQKSSNIYVARLADKMVKRLGKEWYQRALHQIFGFGEKTGVELPSETKGLVPTPGKKHPNGTLEWSVPTPYSLAMGHNIQVSTLQLARAFALFANGGILVQPTLIKKVMRQEESHAYHLLIDHTQPERVKNFPRVLDKEIAKQVALALKFATKPGGTARRADVYGYTEAGKTGTAQKVINGSCSQFLYCPTFVGFVPFVHPAFVLAITLDEPLYAFIPGLGKNHHGGTCAAPIFKEIAKRALDYLGIAPDDPHGYPVADPRYDAKKADWIIETKQLQDLYEKWNPIEHKK